MISLDSIEQEVTKQQAIHNEAIRKKKEEVVKRWRDTLTKDAIEQAIIRNKVKGRIDMCIIREDHVAGEKIDYSELMTTYKGSYNETFEEYMLKLVDKREFNVTAYKSYSYTEIKISWNPIDIYLKRKGYDICKGLAVFVFLLIATIVWFNL